MNSRSSIFSSNARDVLRFAGRGVAFGVVSMIFIVTVVLTVLDSDWDVFYRRIASDKHSSLIVGSSRGAQGLRPEILSRGLGFEFFNFCFTAMHSPYGSTYLEAIYEVLDSTKAGILIAEVSPTALSTQQGEDADVEDKRSFLSRLHRYRGPINLEYLVAQNQPVLTALKNMVASLLPSRPYTVLHRDGWLQVRNVSFSAQKLEKKISHYKTTFMSRHYSRKRFDALERLIRYARSRQKKVYLVRLPVSRSVLQLEQARFPQFSRRMQRISIRLGAVWVDLSDLSQDEITTDGSHLLAAATPVINYALIQAIKH